MNVEFISFSKKFTQLSSINDFTDKTFSNITVISRPISIVTRTTILKNVASREL